MRFRPSVLVLVAAVILLSSACTSTSTEIGSSTTTVVASSTSAAAGGGLVSAAREAIAAWNTSADAFVSRFVPTGTYLGVPIVNDDAFDSLSFYIGLGDSVEVHDCAETSPRSVQCAITGTDDLSGTQGYSFEGGAWMVLDENGLVVTFDWNSTVDGGKISYTEEMVDWVRDEHPDIFSTVFADDACTPERLDCWDDWAESAEAADALLELHAEYLTST